MVGPIMHFHAMSELTDGILCTIFMFFGLTNNRALLEERKTIGALYIAIEENLPQFLIQFFELFVLRTTITFVQAGFPIITLILIYVFIAPNLARIFYNHVFWDGKPSKKDIEGKFVVRTEKDTKYLCVLVLFAMSPPIFMSLMINYKTVSYDKINPELFAEGMLPEMDPDNGQYYLHTIICVYLVVGLVQWRKLKQVFRVSKKQQLPEPDDQWRQMYYHSGRAQVLLPSPIDWYVNKDPSKLRWTPMDD